MRKKVWGRWVKGKQYLFVFMGGGEALRNATAAQNGSCKKGLESRTRTRN